MDWIAIEDALGELSVQKQTLYAYVSRGLVRAKADEGDPRCSLYSAGDIRKGRQAVARAPPIGSGGRAIAWGRAGAGERDLDGPRWAADRAGRSIEQLAAKLTLEDTARRRESGRRACSYPFANRRAQHPRRALMLRRAGEDAPSLGRSPSALRAEAWSILFEFADALTGEQGSGKLYERLARAGS